MAAEGESVEFYCEADGVPKPTITWTRNSEPLSQSEADSRLSLTPDGSRLTLIDLTDSDTANYGCNASNRLGYVYQDVYVNVLSLPAEIIERPKVNTHSISCGLVNQGQHMIYITTFGNMG